MQTNHDLSCIADDDLLRRLVALLAGARRTEADLVAHVGEVDARRLYAREATPSMFAYCTERLHLSEAEACLRIAAARASRQHPVVLEMLADGRLHLSAIAKIAPHLTPENRDALLRRATHRTKREIEELVAELAPRPDVPATIRKLPAGRLVPRLAPTVRAEASSSDPSASTDQPKPRPERVDSDRLGEAGRSADAAAIDASITPRKWVAAPRQSAVIEPLSPARYRVQFTASAELRDKLDRLRQLMRSSVPNGDLSAIIDAAVTEKLERLEARRFGRTKLPRKTASESDTAPRTRHVPAAVKRAVDDRDECRCRYVDAHGNRCTARVRVEYHHRHTYALGGDHSPRNLSLLCHQPPPGRGRLRAPGRGKARGSEEWRPPGPTGAG